MKASAASNRQTPTIAIMATLSSKQEHHSKIRKCPPPPSDCQRYCMLSSVMSTSQAQWHPVENRGFCRSKSNGNSDDCSIEANARCEVKESLSRSVFHDQQRNVTFLPINSILKTIARQFNSMPYLGDDVAGCLVVALASDCGSVGRYQGYQAEHEAESGRRQTNSRGKS
jgi:hypothetical protein